MRWALALTVLLVGCGKTGDRGLAAAARSNHVEIRERGVVYELHRKAGLGFTVATLNIEQTDPGGTAEETVDRFLRAVAREQLGATDAPKQEHSVDRHVFVTIHSSEVPGAKIELEGVRETKEWRANGKLLAVEPSPLDDAYEAMITSIGRRALP